MNVRCRTVNTGHAIYLGLTPTNETLLISQIGVPRLGRHNHLQLHMRAWKIWMHR